MELGMIKILDTLRKRTQLLSFGIVFDSTNRLGVSVEAHEPSISPDELSRLWAAYHAKVLEALRYPTNVDALLASAIIEKITAKPFSFKTDCFARAGLSEVVQYTEDSLAGFIDITGRYYAKEQRRILLADLPGDITAKHLIYGSVGLLQYGLNRCGQDENELTLIFQLAKSILFLLSPDSGHDTSDLTQLPDTAYSLAKRACKPNEDGKNISLQVD
jgi:hypothetical protein